MPLLILTLIGILAFGLFDLTLGRPLPHAVQSSSKQVDLDPRTPEREAFPSLQAMSSFQSKMCEELDKACTLVALYRFVHETITTEPVQPRRLHHGQTPAQTLLNKHGDKADVALLFSSLLDQRHIRNYLVILPQESFVLACDISQAALQHAGGNSHPISSLPGLDSAIETSTRSDDIDAFALNVADEPCPCILVNPSGPRDLQAGDPLPVSPTSFHSAIDRVGRRHTLIPAL